MNEDIKELLKSLATAENAETIAKLTQAIGETEDALKKVVVGEDEMNSKSVTVRARKEGEGGKFTLDEFVAKVAMEVETKKR